MNNFDICLVRASLADAKKIWNMQKEAFAELFEKYQDFDKKQISREEAKEMICQIEENLKKL